MSRLNLDPIERSDQPTSHVTIGKSKLDPGTDVVHVRYDGVRATFEVDPENDRVASTIGNDVYVSPEATKLFPTITPGDPFYVETDASRRDVRAAKRVVIDPGGIAPDQLAAALRDREALVHPIAEEYDLGEQTVSFTVAEVEPHETTVRVTDETDIEFDRSASGPAVGDDDTADATPGGSGGGDEETASIDIQPTDPEASFAEDVAGLAEVKRTAEMTLSLFDPATRDRVIDRYGSEFADRGGGMLLYGPPGCGKTLVSEAIAYEAKYNTEIEQHFGEVAFLEVRGSDVVSKYAGESEKNVEAAFEQAHRIARDGFAVLFFDEVETLIPDRSDDNLQRHERALTNAFLQQMNDVEDNLLVIGATNMPFSIDPAATRRFPIQQFIPQPDADVMAQVWRKSLGELADREDVDCARLGEASVGYTPAEIADRVLGSDLQRELVESVAREDREPITPDTAYLLERLDRTEPKTVRQYVSSVMKQARELEGFPKMKTYVESQARELGMIPGASGDGNEET